MCSILLQGVFSLFYEVVVTTNVLNTREVVAQPRMACINNKQFVAPECPNIIFTSLIFQHRGFIFVSDILLLSCAITHHSHVQRAMFFFSRVPSHTTHTSREQCSSSLVCHHTPLTRAESNDLLLSCAITNHSHVQRAMFFFSCVPSHTTHTCREQCSSSLVCHHKPLTRPESNVLLLSCAITNHSHVQRAMFFFSRVPSHTTHTCREQCSSSLVCHHTPLTRAESNVLEPCSCLIV